MKKKSTWQSAPVRRSLGEGGFFNLRVVIGVFLALASVLLALIGFGAFSNASAQANVGSTKLSGHTQDSIGQQVGQMRVIQAVHSDLSPALRDQPVVWRERREPPEHRKIPFKYKGAPDPVIQSSFWQQPMTPPAIPAPIRDWEGISPSCAGCITGPPPDTNGEVGKTQYVEMAHDALQVFDKLTGTSLLGPFPYASVWFGFSEP